ncbi:MAG: 6-phosphofructokinase [Candidatus Bipolaricaulota bacterium]|nr:6-phosphofructokinase [Candidatus Bipolaricaulota bacterium]MBS3792284.1 6-phosphofructokinase [Candidatus Bipolaricaulota bacterium]
MKKIGVLTSGGDSPGMNAAIRATVRKAKALGLDVVGINSGYEGCLVGDFRELDLKDVGGIIEEGGTMLRSKRAPEFKEKEERAKAIRNFHQEGVEGVIVIGGDGTLRGAKALNREGIPTVCVPATIDNDIYGTDMTIGVDTCLNTVVESIDRIRTTASALERTFIVEVMGRDSGYIALMGGLSGGAEQILIPEVDYDLEKVAKEIYDGYKRGKQHMIVVVAEGIYKEGSAAHHVGQNLKKQIGFEVRVTVLGHMQRGGNPSAFDRGIASRLGAEAVTTLSEGESGVMLGLQGHNIETVDYSEVLSNEKKIDMELYELAQTLAQ